MFAALGFGDAKRLAEDYLRFIPILMIIARCASVQSAVVPA
jgi:hypothetical protein